MKFQKRPETIEALQWTEEDGKLSEMVAFVGNAPDGNPAFGIFRAGPRLWDNGLDRWVPVANGDWVLKANGGKGFWACKPDIFNLTYEKVLGE